MRILNVVADNFGSYEHLEFSPYEQGLTLIYGPTGCGKSTIPDVVAWGLYGTTAKCGNVDDVVSWSNPHSTTTVTLSLVAKDNKLITIYRARGGGNNDLYWKEGDQDDTEIRGNNLSETQGMLSTALGVSEESFSSAAYYNESSATAQFFTANAKTRRATLEQLVDLTLPVELAAKVSYNKKNFKQELKPIQTTLDKLSGAIDQTNRHYNKTIDQASQWEGEFKNTITAEHTKLKKFEELKASKLASLQTKFDAFENKLAADVITLEDRIATTAAKLSKAQENHISCKECGTVKGAEEVTRLQGAKKLLESQLKTTANTVNPYKSQLEYTLKEENHSESIIAQLLTQKNPHIKYCEDLENKLDELEMEKYVLTEKYSTIEQKLSALDQLYDLSFDLRGLMLKNTVKQIEEATNRSLETYFDSEFRVSFTIEGGDAIEVAVTKDGYQCAFRQLSKGQKQLLKLCFASSAMEVAANQVGCHFDQVFFDEALDGLDVSLKVKAFGLFESIAKSRSSVFIIEHSSEFQELCSNKWKVTLKGQKSELNTEGA